MKTNKQHNSLNSARRFKVAFFTALMASVLAMTHAGLSEAGSNTAYGDLALYSNTAGENNSAYGYLALYKNTTGAVNTAIGTAALGSNITGSQNTASGSAALASNSTGNQNTASGVGALKSNTTGKYNTALGVGADVTAGNLSNATAIGYNAKVNASNKVRIGNTSVTKIEGQVPWTSTSDQRLKKHIADLPLGLNFINQMRPVEYIRNNNSAHTKEWGIIAQELEQTLKNVDYPNASIVTEDGSPEKYLSVRYNDFLAPMIKAIQEQDKKNTLSTRNYCCVAKKTRCLGEKMILLCSSPSLVGQNKHI